MAAVRVVVAVHLLGTAALIAKRVLTGRVSRPVRAAGGGFPEPAERDQGIPDGAKVAVAHGPAGQVPC